MLKKINLFIDFTIVISLLISYKGTLKKFYSPPWVILVSTVYSEIEMVYYDKQFGIIIKLYFYHLIIRTHFLLMKK